MRGKMWARTEVRAHTRGIAGDMSFGRARHGPGQGRVPWSCPKSLPPEALDFGNWT